MEVGSTEANPLTEREAQLARGMNDGSEKTKEESY